MWHFILYHSCVRKNVTLHMLSFIPKKECDIFGYIISFMCISEKECVISDFFCIFIYILRKNVTFLVLLYHSYIHEKECDSFLFYIIIHICVRKNMTFMVLFYHFYPKKKIYSWVVFDARIIMENLTLILTCLIKNIVYNRGAHESTKQLH